MSAASGSQSKEASKKFKGLNINTIFKGKTLDTATKAVITKHGMQSLGKVSTCRRIPPVAIPSLKAENCGNDPNVNLVPAGGQGWGSKAGETPSETKPADKSSFSENQTQSTERPNQPQSSQTSASNVSAIDKHQSDSVPSNSSGTNTKRVENWVKSTLPPNPGLGGPIPKSGTNNSAVPWNNVSTHSPGEAVHSQAHPLDGGPRQSGSAQPSQFFHREFPKLSGGPSHSELAPQYGPGPSLRPETKGSWIMSGAGGPTPLQQDDIGPNGRYNGKGGFNQRPVNMGPRSSPPAAGLPAGGMNMGPDPRVDPSKDPMGQRGGAPIPPPYKTVGPQYMRGPPGPRPGYGPPGPPAAFMRNGRYRGQAPPVDEHAVPPPIIRKEDLDNFEPVPAESDAWANSHLDVDYNKKLNFSEDEASVEDEKVHWKKEKYKDASENMDRSASQKRPGNQNAWDKKNPDKKFDGSDRAYPTDSSSRRPQPHYQSRNSYERNMSDYTRKSASPSTYEAGEDSGKDNRDTSEVQLALERARHLEKEEEKRYEEKKKFEHSKKGRGEFEYNDTEGFKGAKENESSNSYQDGRDKENWDMNQDMHERGRNNRNYRNYDNRRDPGHRDQYRDQYDARQHRDPQAMYSGSFKNNNKLPPRFQKQQQQQQQQDFHRSGGPFRGGQHPPSLFDNRHMHHGRQPSRGEGNRSGRMPKEGDQYHEEHEDQSSRGRSWNGSWSNPNEDREHWEAQQQNNWGGHDRREHEKDRDGRNSMQKEKWDYDNRKSDGRNNWEDKSKRYENDRNQGESQHYWNEGDAKPDRRNDRSYKEEEFKDRPQRPESRDSRTSRESTGSSFPQREKKQEGTSWADSTTEFDDHYRSDSREDAKSHFEVDNKVQNSFNNEYNESGSEALKDNSRSVMAPAPITKERLEASETEKEVRKNMTTLRRNQPLQDVRKQGSPKEIEHNQVEGKSSSSWTPKPKNDRSRPDILTPTPLLNSSGKSPKNSTDPNLGKQEEKEITNTSDNQTQKVGNVWKQKERVDVRNLNSESSHTTSGDSHKGKAQGGVGYAKSQHDSSKYQTGKVQHPNTMGDAKKQTSLAQESSSAANAGAEMSNTDESLRGEKSGKDKVNNSNKDKSAPQKSTKPSRYDDPKSTRGNRGKAMMGSYPMYRGRGGARGYDYNRRGGSARGDVYSSRMQSRGYRQQDYYYYDYMPPGKDHSRSEHYGSWGSRGDPRRNRMHNTRPINISEVPSLMDAEIRKHPNNYYERIPPRFQNKRGDQESHDSSHKTDNKLGRGSGRQSDKKFPSNSQRPKKEESPDTQEDADWETASESSDHDRAKDKRSRSARDRKPNKVERKNPNAKSNDYPPTQKDKPSSVTRTGDVKRQSSPSRQDRSKFPMAIRAAPKSLMDSTIPDNDSDSADKNKNKQDKSNTLEGIDLSNFASVVIVDNQPQISETFDDGHDTNFGFKEVTRRKVGRDKSRVQDEDSGSPTPGRDGGSFNKKDKKRNKGNNVERSRQSKLPPRLTKKRETNRNFNSASNFNGSFPNETSVPPPPPKNAWEKPLTSALRTNSPHGSFQDKVSTEVAHENHDSGVEVSDPPNSTGSSQRSSPSDNPVLSRQDKAPVSSVSNSQDKVVTSSIMNFTCVDKSVLDGSSVPSQTIIFENTNYKGAGTVGAEFKAKFGSESQKAKLGRDRKDDACAVNQEVEKPKPEPIELPLGFKTDENVADMKLDFTFDQELADLSTDKTGRTVRASALSSPSSPSTNDLNRKIASVKKVWDMTPLTEHPEDPATTFSPSSFAAVESANLEHAPVLDSFSCKETVGVEESASDMSYQTASLHQVSAMNAVTMDYATTLPKTDTIRNVGVGVCKLKPEHENMSSMNLASHTLAGTSISPPLASMGQSSSMYLGGTPAFGGLGGAAIPSPPTVMLNSSQTLQQAGLFQPLFDGTTVLGNRGASQFSQYSYGIGNSAAFGQQSVFLQTPPPLSAPADLYTNNLSQYRVQPNPVAGFGQNHTQPQNQNTVLISSASTTLMSSAVKPSTHTFGSSQQSFGTIGSKAGTPFQQSGLGGTLQGSTLQGGPQPSVYIFDPNHSIGLLNPQLVQRTGVPNSVIQTIQPPNSFYSNNAAAAPGAPTAAPPGASAQQAAANFYAASGSPLQAAVQQQAQSALQNPAFGMPNFANQSGPAQVGIQNFGSGMNLTQQQIAAQTFRSNLTGQQPNFLKNLQPPGSMPDTTRQQIKSPGLSHNSLSSYFPVSSVSSGMNMNTCNVNGGINSIPAGGLSMNSAMNGGSVPGMSQISSPKSQNRKVSGVSPVNNVSKTGPSNVYGAQSAAQMGNMSGLRQNMSMGMQNQLGMVSPHSLPASSMNSGPMYSGPGPIQRPLSQHSSSLNAVQRPIRVQPPPSGGPMHSGPPHRATNPSSAQQAKLRADALSATQAFFARDGPNAKCDKKMDKSPVSDSSDKETKTSEPLTGPSSSQAEIPSK